MAGQLGGIQAVRVDDLDVATPAQSAARLFGMLPLFLIVAAFVGGLNVAIEATAGERERRSLEPLLVNPVSRAAVTVGKWLATCVFGLVAAVLTLVLSLFMMRFVPLEEVEPRRAPVAADGTRRGPDRAARLGAADVRGNVRPQLQGSADLREPPAHRADAPRSGDVRLPAAGRRLDDAGPRAVAALLLVDIMGGEPVGLLALAASVAGTLLLTLVCLASIARMLQQEKIVFGRV